MAFSQTVLESELAKQRSATAGWPWRLLTLSSVILLTVGAVYLGMRFGFEEAYLKNALAEAEAKSAETFKLVSSDEQKQIFNFYSQLSNVGTLLKKQGKGSIYLDMIEKNTLKAVVYTSIDVKIDDRLATIKMDGKTASYFGIVQQMELYKRMANVKDVKLSGARLATQSGDGVSFSIQVIINR